MLDEFYQFGRMPEIVDRAPLVAGYGFQIAVIAQGLTQWTCVMASRRAIC